MKGFAAFFAKELRELLRTKRLRSAVQTITDFHDLHRTICHEAILEVNPQEMF